MDILEKYFERIGGRPIASSKASSIKKRGRKPTTSTPDQSAKKVKLNGSARGRAKAEDEDEEDVKWPKGNSKENFEPPFPHKDAWEDHVVAVQTIEVDPEDQKKWVYLTWVHEDADGKKQASRTTMESAKRACPQAVGSCSKSYRWDC